MKQVKEKSSPDNSIFDKVLNLPSDGLRIVMHFKTVDLDAGVSLDELRLLTEEDSDAPTIVGGLINQGLIHQNPDGRYSMKPKTLSVISTKIDQLLKSSK